MGFKLIGRSALVWNLIDLGHYNSASAIIAEMLNSGHYNMALFLHEELRDSKNNLLANQMILEYV